MEKIILLIIRVFIDLFLKILTFVRKQIDKKINPSPADVAVIPEVKEPSPQKMQKKVHAANTTQVQSTAVPKLQKSPVITEEQAAWQGKLDHDMMINGVIFSEVLQPPRAYRPFIRLFK